MTAITLATYADLISILSTSAGFLHRTDTADIMPLCVQMCETTINYGDGEDLDGLTTAAQETIGTLTTVAGTQTVALPTDYLSIRKLYLTVGGVRRELIQAPTTPMRMSETGNYQSIPETYIITGGNLYLFPKPDSAYTLTIDYYTKVGPLVTQSTNWLLTAAPMVYLGGTVLHGAPWFGPTFNPAPWEKMFRTGMKQVQGQDDARFENVTLRTEVATLIRQGFDIRTGGF